MMRENNKRARYSRGQVLRVRLKQFATTFFVVVTSTLMIQNVWSPVSFSSFKKTWRAGVGSVIFLMGFAVARVLFEMYGEQVRQIKRGDAGPPAGQEEIPSGGLEAGPEEPPMADDNVSEELDTEYEPKAGPHPG